MFKKHMKRCSVSLIIRDANQKLQRAIYHYIPVRMAIIKKSTNSTCWRRCGEKGTLFFSHSDFYFFHYSWFMVLSVSTVQQSDPVISD